MVERGVTGGSGTVTDKQEIQTNNNRREYKQREMCDVEDVTGQGGWTDGKQNTVSKIVSLTCDVTDERDVKLDLEKGRLYLDLSNGTPTEDNLAHV